MSKDGGIYFGCVLVRYAIFTSWTFMRARAERAFAKSAFPYTSFILLLP